MTENKEKAQSSHITNFLRNIINEDLKQGVNDPRHWCGHPGTYTEQMEGPIDEAKVRLRFPPEPNGYLHIGHAKSICLNFGLAKDYAGRCHMRFDDTNPVKEDQEYVDSILGSVNWLGFDWKDAKETNYYFASDYFDYMYEIAEHLIKNGLAYVDEQSAEQIKENRSVSLIFAPEGYEPALQMPPVNDKYTNNYRQQRALLEMQGRSFVDLGCAVAVEQCAFPAALSRIAYAHYATLDEVVAWLAGHDGELQCVVTGCLPHSRRVGFGCAQSPTLTDYPDDRDVLAWLAALD